MPLVLRIARVAMVAAGVALALPVARAEPTVGTAMREMLGASSSIDRSRAAYALMRFHDPERMDDRELVDRTWFAGTWVERAAALRGACDRAWPNGLPKAHRARVLEVVEKPDTELRVAAIECLDRMPPAEAADLRARQLMLMREQGHPSEVTRAVLASVARHPDRRHDVELAHMGGSLFGTSGSEIVQLTDYGAWVLTALAAHGTDTRERFAATLKLAAETDYLLAARLNRIGAASGDAKAAAALLETAKIAMEPELRREAILLLFSQPDAPRRAALAALASRTEDIDGQTRERIVREASRETVAIPAPDDAATEIILTRSLSDAFPDLRITAAAGLLDRARAGRLSDAARAAAKRAAASEKDPLAAEALAILVRAP